MSDLIQKIISEQTEKFLTEKKRLIRTTLWKATGVELDIDAECKRRFPRLLCIHQHSGGEVWYWNDSTGEGLRLITFYKSNPKIDFTKELTYNFTIEETYQIP